MASPLSIQRIKGLGWKPDKPDYRDARMTPQAVRYPAEHLLPLVHLPPVRDQGDQGSCTGHAVRSLGQYMRSVSQQPKLELSPRFIYWNARVIEGTSKDDAGAEIRDAIKSVAKLGFAREEFCKYDPKNWTTPPDSRAFNFATFDMAIEYARIPQTMQGLKGCLYAGYPFVFGLTIYENFDTPETRDKGLLSGPSGSVVGGHAVWCCGYSDARKSFLIANSWGTEWGCHHPQHKVRGYFWLAYDYILNNNLADDFWTIRKVS